MNLLTIVAFRRSTAYRVSKVIITFDTRMIKPLILTLSNRDVGYRRYSTVTEAAATRGSP